MITLLITLLMILLIAFIWNSFIAIIITLIAIITGYFVGTYGAFAVVVIFTIASGIYKFIKNR